VLVTGELKPELELDVDDDAVQCVNVLIETVKLQLLTEMLPVNWLRLVAH
jgi:hypothetical protein